MIVTRVVLVIVIAVRDPDRDRDRDRDHDADGVRDDVITIEKKIFFGVMARSAHITERSSDVRSDSMIVENLEEASIAAEPL